MSLGIAQVFAFDAATTLRAGLDPSGEPYVIAADVCRTFGVKNVADALGRLDDDEKGIVSIDTPGGKQSLACVSESGFYALVLSFRLRKVHPFYEKAKAFRKWVTGEVLPAIRKTGRYETRQAVGWTDLVPASTPAPSSELSIAEWTGRLVEQTQALHRLAIEHERIMGRVETIEAFAVQVDRKVESARAAAEMARDAANTATLASDAALHASSAALSASCGDTGFVTLMGFCKLHRISLSRAELSRVGLQLRKICERDGIPFRHVPHETYGKVNVWPVELLERWERARKGASAKGTPKAG